MMRKLLLFSLILFILVGCIRHYEDRVDAGDAAQQEVNDTVVGDQQGEVSPPDVPGLGDVDVVLKDTIEPEVTEDTVEPLEDTPMDTPTEVVELDDTVDTKDVCVPDCNGKACGPDGCDGLCGSCGEDYACEDGACVYQPGCGDGTCSAGLSENCETCPADCPCECGEICESGTCTFTACDGKECGTDGCGGSCGTCGCGEECSAGSCDFTACDGKECGADGCGGSCGTCPDGESCGVVGLCGVECNDGACGAGEDYCNCPADCAASTCAGCCAGTVCKVGTADNQCGGGGSSCQNCLVQDKSCVNQQCQCQCDDGMCCGSETCCTCPSDCGCWCGNGVCDCNETCENCGVDCGACPTECDPSCVWEREECVQATTGEWACAAKTVEILAGNFWMGCNNCANSAVNETGCKYNEHPYHKVYLDTYEMDRTEVTADQYHACVSAGGCTTPNYTGDYATYQVAGKENHPINYVTATQGEAYCQWAGKTLCTEAQWEKGARGGCEHNGGLSNCKAESRTYPWGNDAPTCNLTVMGGCPGETQPVCSLSVAGDSPNGLCDMAGNVNEWVADWYLGDYYCDGDAASGDGECIPCGGWPGSPDAWSNPVGPGNSGSRISRGGAFDVSNAKNLRVALRETGDQGFAGDFLGFRCCKSGP